MALTHLKIDSCQVVTDHYTTGDHWFITCSSLSSIKGQKNPYASTLILRLLSN